MVVVRQFPYSYHLTVLDPSEYIARNQTPPTFTDRSDDVAWMLACTLLIFTMQTGIALIESGMCSLKNEVHLLMKNMAACCAGGLMFWAFGWAFCMGDGPYSTPFFGWGDFFYEPDWLDGASAEKALTFFYQLSLSALSTSIVSGAMAERCNFKSFLVFATFNVFTYSLPAYWIWSPNGWLKKLGAKDNAGCGVVHLVGGWSSLVATTYLGPRTGISESPETVVMGNPTFCCAGMFITWWGYLAMNSASTLGVEGTRWLQSAKGTVLTMICSFGGGTMGLLLCYIYYGGHTIHIGKMVTTVLGSLVSYGAITFLCTTTETMAIGAVSALIVFFVHGLCGMWGMIAVGIFAREDTVSEGFTFNAYNGLLYGDYYLLGVQCLAVVSFAAWASLSTLVILRIIDAIFPIRADLVTELIGSDLMEHNILHSGIGIDEALSVLNRFYTIDNVDIRGDPHKKYIADIEADANSSMEFEYNFEDNDEAKLAKIALLLGVEKVSQKDIDQFLKNIKSVQPRKVEGYGFGKLPAYLHQD